MKTTNSPGVLFAVFLLLFMGALLWFFSSAEQYYTYFTQATQETPGRVDSPNQQTHVSNPSFKIPFDTEVKYRKFFVTAPGTKQVELQGDFNRWGKDPIFLTAYKKGYFETSVALAGGEYKYVFVLDGKEIPDPSNQDRQTLPDGREVCIKTVR